MRKYRVQMAALSVLVAVVLASAPTMVWADWPVIQTVDSTGNVGVDTSLALDSSGFAHISYRYRDPTNTDGDLKYTVWDGSNWAITTVDSTGDVGEDTSLALDSRGFAHISYFAASNQDLKYANNTPELPPSALLGLSMVPLGLAYLRGRRRKESQAD